MAKRLMISRTKAKQLAEIYGSFCEAKSIYLAGNKSSEMSSTLHMLAGTLRMFQAETTIELAGDEQLSGLMTLLEAEMDAMPINPKPEILT